MPTNQSQFLNRSLWAAQADTDRAHAEKLKFNDYFAVARTRDVDQAFWQSLLPTHGQHLGAVLVLETRLGALSARLAPYFKTVISWHASFDAAEITRQFVGQQGLDNIRTVVAGHISELDLGSDRLAAVVFYCPSGDLTKQWSTDGTALLRSIVRALPRILADNGVVLIGENNRWSYKLNDANLAGIGRRGSISLLAAQRMTSHNFADADTYVCSSAITSAHAPLPDFVLLRESSVGSIYPKNLIGRVKNKILHSRLVRLFWPSFLFIASSHPFLSMLKETLRHTNMNEKMCWGAHDSVCVKRIIAGNSGTTIVMVGPENRDTKDVIVRFPNGSSALKLCRTNSMALKRLAATSLSSIVPRLICEGSWQNRDFTIESRCQGLEVFYGTRHLEGMVHEACHTLSVLHIQTAKLTSLADSHFNERVGPLIEDIAKYCAPAVRTRLDCFAAALRSALRGREVSLGYTHGDFKIGNILFDHTRKLSALIDWDGFAEEGFQLFDYLTLLNYKISNEKAMGFADVYIKYLLPWKLPVTYSNLVDEFVCKLAGDTQSFLLIRVVFWFSLISTRFDPVFKQHANWQGTYLHSVLPALESLSQAGWQFPEKPHLNGQ